MTEESKYCSDVMKKYFNKELVTIKEDNQDCENSTKFWICAKDYVDNDVKLRYHRHVTGKYRDPLHRDCHINFKLNNKIFIVFHNLKNYDSHLIMQELSKFNLKINVIPNALGKYMSFTINNKLSFIDSFQFLSSSLDSLVKNLSKDDFKHSSKEFGNNALDLINQKGFYPFLILICDFEKFKEELSSIEKSPRRGISYICNRYSKAKNKYLKSYDLKQESKHIMYLDTNNLCGYAMSNFLPKSGFKWKDPKEFNLNKICYQ